MTEYSVIFGGWVDRLPILFQPFLFYPPWYYATWPITIFWHVLAPKTAPDLSTMQTAGITFCVFWYFLALLLASNDISETFAAIRHTKFLPFSPNILDKIQAKGRLGLWFVLPFWLFNLVWKCIWFPFVSLFYFQVTMPAFLMNFLPLKTIFGASGARTIKYIVVATVVIPALIGFFSAAYQFLLAV